ncbi:MAG TPA: DUF302 domain-containing protein [Caldimonas sp.]|jgi:uncharacterized protein (DUF302 family)
MLNFLKQCIAALCIGTILLVLTTVAEADGNVAGDDGLVRVRSAYPVDQTVARIRQDIAAKGITFFQEVDQAKLAAGAGIALRPSTLIVFGNPPLGAQFLTSNPYSGLDWPVRVLVLEEPDGSVWVAWTDFAWIARRHHIADRQPQFAMATSVVESITSTILAK